MGAGPAPMAALRTRDMPVTVDNTTIGDHPLRKKSLPSDGRFQPAIPFVSKEGNIVNSKKRVGGLLLAVLSLLAPGRWVAADELWVAPTHIVPPGLNVFPWPTTGTGLASFVFAIPD